MLPALTTKPKQTVRQVRGLTDDSIDSYSNMPVGGSSGVMTASYGNGTSGTAHVSPVPTGRSAIVKPFSGEGRYAVARVIRDRKASGEEELSLRTGGIVKVLSTKRTGYLKCEVDDKVGYVPSSYLEFLDADTTGVENENSTFTSEGARRSTEKQRKKLQQKKKLKKEKHETNDTSESIDGIPVTVRTVDNMPGNIENEDNEVPCKRKKKDRKHRQDREINEGSQRRSVDEPSNSARSRSKSKHPKKKHHRDVYSSDSSESDRRKRKGRHRRRHHHRHGLNDSDSSSTFSDDSDESYRRKQRRRRHRHRHSSSEDEEDEDSNYKRHSRRNKKHQGSGDIDFDEGSRSARKAEKKKATTTLQEMEKGVSELDVKSDNKASELVHAKIPVTLSSKIDETCQVQEKTEDTERSERVSEAQASNASMTKKDNEGRTSSDTSSSTKHKGNISGFGKQIGEKMRSLLGGGKKQFGSKNSSGILNACEGTAQGEEGWYEHGENERYYFVLADGKWSLLYGPITEDDFETLSNQVLEQKCTIKLPPTYLHKSGYYLNRQLRVQREL